ncbi:hypothetical protein TNCV_1332991 [Trichonephila clavipes]|nr:hypothetical protein TNCV_1332991 [Trichonephila clavipes]
MSFDDLCPLKLSENKSDGGELSCSNVASDEGQRLSDSHCKESEGSADEIDHIPVNSDIYGARDGTEGIPHSGKVLDRFAIRNVFRQSSSTTNFAEHNVNVTFYVIKDHNI